MVTAIKGNDTSTFGGNVDVTGNVITDAPAFSAYQSSAQSISSATWTLITFDSTEYNVGNMFDTSTNTFQPTVAGYYFIHAMVRFAATTANKVLVARIYKNGSYYSAFEGGSSSGDSSTQTSGLMYMNGSTDYVEFYSYQNSGGNLNTGSYNNATVVFEGYLVRAA